ncbi:MAG: ROK family protein [Eubacteriales bacterium]|nr:ROK family protein [Eubacteriales bacterium]
MAKSRNIDYRKWEKKNLILHIIRNDPYSSRSSVKKASRLSMDSVLQYISELLDEKLIYEAGTSDEVIPPIAVSPGVGRKATILSINPEGCYFIGVKFNASVMTGLTMDFAGNASEARRIRLGEAAGADEIIKKLYSFIDELIISLGDKRNLIRGIGIGVPGLVDSLTGIAAKYVHIKGWNNLPLKKLVEEKFGMKVYVEQSIKATTIALKMTPENIMVRDMLYILISRGIGMVIISGNRICMGHANAAGEIGHLFAADNGIQCECGKYGCLETEAGSNSIIRKLEEGIKKGRFTKIKEYISQRDETVARPEIADLRRALSEGDPDAGELLSEIAGHMSKAVSAAVTLLNPEKIVFSGEIAHLPGLSDSIIDEIKKRCSTESFRDLIVETSLIDDAFDAEGAARLVWLHEFNTGTDVFEGRYGQKR